MRVTRNPELATELLDEMWAEYSEDRTGQHPSASDLHFCLTKTWLDWKATVETDTPSPALNQGTKVMYLIGLGLERSLLIKRRTGANPTGEHDGIFWHADLMQDGHLLELKSTRANKKKFDAGEFPLMHVRQMKTYCVANGVSSCDYGVVFVIPAEFEVYHLEFDADELATHWMWMKERKTVWNLSTHLDKPPTPFSHNEAWECKIGDGCRWQLFCTLHASARPRAME